MTDDRKQPSPFGARECGKVFSGDDTKICVRPAEHLGLHRNTKTPRNRGAFSWGDNESAAEGPVESPVREGQEFVHVEDGSRAVVKRVTDSPGSAEPVIWCTLSQESQEHLAQLPRTIFLSSYRPLSEENPQ